MNISTKLNADQAIAWLDNAVNNFEPVVSQAMERGCVDVTAQAALDHPRWRSISGNAAGSFAYKKLSMSGVREKNIQFLLGIDGGLKNAPYAIYLHDGTRRGIVADNTIPRVLKQQESSIQKKIADAISSLFNRG